MDEQKSLANALHQLRSITDDAIQESAQEDLLKPLREAPTASLFVLSRQAASQAVRSEAAALLTARLREDHEEEGDSPLTDGATLDELPPELATHRHFFKFPEGGQWVLTTRSGVRVAVFSSEAELDQWWRALKRQRGRILTRKRSKTPPDSAADVSSPAGPPIKTNDVPSPAGPPIKTNEEH